jgi:hypothetical protein
MQRAYPIGQAIITARLRDNLGLWPKPATSAASLRAAHGHNSAAIARNKTEAGVSPGSRDTISLRKEFG